VVRVVIASSALSMGVNNPDVKYGPAQSVVDHIQQAGELAERKASLSMLWLSMVNN